MTLYVCVVSPLAFSMRPMTLTSFSPSLVIASALATPPPFPGVVFVVGAHLACWQAFLLSETRTKVCALVAYRFKLPKLTWFISRFPGPCCMWLGGISIHVEGVLILESACLSRHKLGGRI